MKLPRRRFVQPGAGGSLDMQAVLNSPPDGYTK